MDCWIFGYGSLIWKTGFPFTEARVAKVEGFERRFWQGSVDHRGVPGAPGRVVTLVADSAASCWGQAYRLSAETRDAVLEHLDVREVGGYERHALTIHLDHGECVEGLTWVAWADNSNFLGRADSLDIARQAYEAVGPSGPNAEYVLRLDEILNAMGKTDPHVAEIATHLRSMTD